MIETRLEQTVFLVTIFSQIVFLWSRFDKNWYGLDISPKCATLKQSIEITKLTVIDGVELIKKSSTINLRK